MIIFGLDPGLANLGLGVIETEGTAPTLLYSGDFKTTSSKSFEIRLVEIYDRITRIVTHIEPDVIAIEKMPHMQKFAGNDAVERVIGVIRLVCGQHRLAFAEYAVTSVKKAVTGSGRAEKVDVIKAVRTKLAIGNDRLTDHTADALAVALTHFYATGGKAA